MIKLVNGDHHRHQVDKKRLMTFHDNQKSTECSGQTTKGNIINQDKKWLNKSLISESDKWKRQTPGDLIKGFYNVPKVRKFHWEMRILEQNAMNYLSN